MANLSKERRDRMIAKLEELKLLHNDDASIASLNEIENALREKKYGLVWEEHSEAVDDMLKENIPVLVADPERRLCKDKNLPWNFIIEGDNLQALYLLEKTHRGKVDCIYIDPPYNSGASDWKYNNRFVAKEDNYRHSKWLSMMKNRLLLARQLLNPRDSVLICTIDEKEYLRLGCLLEELFPSATIQMVSSVINSKGVARNEFFRVNEYLFFVKIGGCSPTPLSLHKDWLGNIKTSTTEKVRWGSLMRSGTHATPAHSPGCFYPIFISKDKKTFCGAGEPIPVDSDLSEYVAPEGTIALFPVHDNGEKGVWQYSKNGFLSIQAKGYARISTQTKSGLTIRYISEGWQKKVEKGVIKVVGKAEDGSLIFDDSDYVKEFIPNNQWWIASHDATEFGSKYLKKFIGDRFPFPKSLYAVHDAIRFFVSKKPDAVVLDFFAGSGTTMHAVNLLNEEDGGQRRCILVTNNEIGIDDERRFAVANYGNESLVQWDKSPTKKSAHYLINYKSQEFQKYKDSYGIAKYVTWPRVICAIQGIDINGVPINGSYLTTDQKGCLIPMSRGFRTNVKYLSCSWTPRKPDDYLLSNALCLHVKELIELQTAQEVDGIKNVVILSKMDYKRVFEDPAKASLVEHVWVNENLVFSAAEMRILREKKFRYIPREFFSQELKEVGEYV